ncbi:FHA domain containing protein [Janthinobacterium sp. HH01]|uniref:FHA domain-containing protein n=1 Tax=Janthinobacterium sp. HH01 TaxID=1198452 RepID=UPI0002AEB890|nr:FHA domain-containing protein [Janthinobacterium sp. HH01]ELX11005.1 FHA domain containing protein [Janthinobacterium sp. HH01]
MAKILISRDGQLEQQIQLSKERMTIGRHPRNDIVLTHPAVSGDHAVIVTILDDSFLEDLHSTNGTFVNGHRIGKHFLQHQDVIKMAKFQVEFIADGVRPMMAAAPVLAQIEVLNGNNAGKQMALTKPQTTLGRAGVQVVVIHRHPDAYTITHQEGAQAPLVNDLPLGKQPQRLNHGDVIDLGGTHMAFRIA